MRIIKAGKNFNEMLFRKTCSVCDTAFEFEGSEGTFSFPRSKNGVVEGVIQIDCPSCGAPQEVTLDHGICQKAKAS